MSEDTQSTNLQLSEEAEKDVQEIATDVDFKPYLDIVNSDSQRTRAVLVVLVAALLLIFTAYRNTSFPDWTDARLNRLQHAALCFEKNLQSDDCTASKKYAKDFLLQGSFDYQAVGCLNDKGELVLSSLNDKGELVPGKELTDELTEQIKAFIRQRTDALLLHLPFFGIAIDMNDLGMVCGLLLIAILYILYASLKSETLDLEKAKAKALKAGPKKEESLELLLMSQVLASPSRSRGIGQGLYLLFILVPVLQFFVVRSDQASLPVAKTLEGARWALGETFLDWIAFGFVVALTGMCIVQQIKLNRELNDLV